jgi:hypothetical protein
MKSTFFSLFEKTLSLINMTMYVIIALAVMGFMWGIVKTLFNSDNEIAKKEGRAFMLYGVITLFVMTSVWGLVYLLRQTFDIPDQNDVNYQGDVNYTEQNRILDPATQPSSIKEQSDIFENNLEQRMI